MVLRLMEDAAALLAGLLDSDYSQILEHIPEQDTFLLRAGIGWKEGHVSSATVEVDPIKALEAAMEGFNVMPIAEASEIGDVFVSLTGNIAVFRQEHFEKMKDGAIVANSGHFNVELDLEALEKMANKRQRVRDHVEQYTLASGKRINVLGEGRLINLAAAEGHPASVMDMSFSNQALACEYLVGHHGKLKNEVIRMTDRIDNEIAALKLKTMGLKIDTLTDQQERYLASWEQGT